MNDSIFFAGLDLGQVNDPTALAILERPRIRYISGPAPVYSARYLKRFPLGSPYPAIIAGVRDILTRPPLDKCPVFVAVDRTGVGRPVSDLLRPIFPGMAAVTITGGQESSSGPDGFTVPKRVLASILQVLLQGRRLLVAQSLPDAQQFVRELQSFKAKINVATGNESYEAWRSSDKDDLVLAVALAAWLGEEIVAVAEREAIEEAAEAEMMRYAQATRGGVVLWNLYL
jgi:hypothetical protein